MTSIVIETEQLRRPMFWNPGPSDQSYKRSTIINYDSRVVMIYLETSLL